MEEAIKESAFKVVRFIASPLRFYAFTIASILSAICVLAWKSNLSSMVTGIMVFILIILVCFLLVLVTILLIFHPKKLVFDQEAHLAYLREKLGDNTLTETYLPGSLPAQEPPKMIDRRQ
jgi:ABC-type transport system involved in multi-copper enzyme maturation permease subunit